MWRAVKLPKGNRQLSRKSESVGAKTAPRIERHKTAIRRPSFSLPVKCALRDSLLSSERTFFDYGCGHGRDLQFLADLQIECSGWDPNFAPDIPLQSADVVNIGYVLNVIEDLEERAQAMRGAWALCRNLLVVAAQIEFAAPDKEQQSYSDGVLTSRGTFQKYYNQNELREYIESELGEDAISAAPGVYYVFKCEEAKQQFIANRYHRAISVPRRKISEVLFDQNKDVLEPFMDRLTQLGRLPLEEELEVGSAIVERFGSIKRAFKLVQKVTDESPWEEIAQKRTEDLLVYLALSRFRKRPPQSQIPITVQQDIKEFFGGFKIACARADTLLYRAGDPNAIDAACQRAGVGKLTENALVFHRSGLEKLEPLLRIYEGCARALVGDIDEANVIKLHRFSGKVTYIAYHNFDKDPYPELKLRVKVALPTLSIDVFDYSEWQDPILLITKAEFVPDDYPKKVLFNKLKSQQDRLELFGNADQIRKSKLPLVLHSRQLTLKGHRLIST